MPVRPWLDRDLLTEAPFPIAYSLRRCREVRRDDAHARILALLDVVEATTRWCATLVLASYRKAGFFDRSFNNELLAAFRRKPTLGDWVYLVRRGLKAFHRMSQPFPLSDLRKALMGPRGDATRAARVLDDLVATRNRLIHGGFADTDRAEAGFEELAEGLAVLLERLRPTLMDCHPVALSGEDVPGTDVVPLVGASGDFYARDGFGVPPFGVGLGRTVLVGGPDHRPILELSPFFHRLTDGRPVFLTRMQREGNESLARWHVALRSFASGEEFSPTHDAVLAEGTLLGAMTEVFDGLSSRVRRVSAVEIAEMPAVRAFPSMASELQERRRVFVGRDAELLRVREWVEHLDSPGVGTEPVMFVTGGMGLGKTALLVNVVFDMGAVFHLVAPSEGRDRPKGVLMSLAAQVAERIGAPMPAETPEDVAEAGLLLSRMLSIASRETERRERRPLLLVIDNLDGFDDGGARFLDALPLPTPGCGLLMSARLRPKARRFPDAEELQLSPLSSGEVTELVGIMLPDLEDARARPLAERLVDVTRGSPLLLQMLLRDRELLRRRDEIDEPEDAFRILVERFDGRADEDDWEGFLALLGLAREPLPRDLIAKVLQAKRRKVDAFCRVADPYLLRPDGDVAFAASQVGERLLGAGREGLDPGVVSRVLRAFTEHLKAATDERAAGYRQRHLGALLGRLPEPPRLSELASWVDGAEFRAKVASGSRHGIAAVDDVRRLLEASADPGLLRRLFRDLLSSEQPDLVVGALLMACSLPEVESDLDAHWERLRRHADPWVRATAARLRRNRMNHRSRQVSGVRVGLLNFVAHFPLVARFADGEDDLAVVVTDGFSTRVELALRDRVEFLATTLDEVAVLRDRGAEYVPFQRLVHSNGADAVVVPPGAAAGRIEDLEGLEVGFEVDSVSPVWLAQLLQDRKVHRSRVRFRAFPCGEDCARALAEGSLGAAVLFEPWVGKSGGKVIARSGDVDQVIQDVLCVRADRMDSLVAPARKLVQTWEESQGRLDPSELDVIRRFWDFDDDEAALSDPFAGLRWIGWQESRRLFLDGAEEPGGVLRVAKRLARQEGLRAPLFDIERARAFIRAVEG